MKIFLTFLSLSLTTACLAGNFQATKKQAKQLWMDHRESFYCGCTFDKHLIVNPASCNYTPVDERRAKKIEWEHLVPVSWFGRHRSCWHEAKVKGHNPRAYCEKTDPIFKKMLNDLHNLVPAIGEVNKARSNYGFGMVTPKTSFNGCELSIDPDLKKVEPKDNLKGMVARAHLYMAMQYGKNQFTLSKSQYKQYKAWHQTYPPSQWERTWNERIGQIQGTDNRFISRDATSQEVIVQQGALEKKILEALQKVLPQVRLN